MTRLNFSAALLFAPLAYALHHIEEHVLFHFREWRLKYFADNNSLSTETVFCILTAITLIYLILHALTRTRASAQSVILFLMATQLHNAFFHVGGTLYFNDWSPGTVTAVLLYLPVSALVLFTAFREGWITRASGASLIVLGGVLFWTFEAVGPKLLPVVVFTTWGWIFYDFRRQTFLTQSQAAA